MRSPSPEVLTNLTLPDIASARSVRSSKFSPHRLSYRQCALSLVFAALALPGIATIAPPTVFGQTGQDQTSGEVGPQPTSTPIANTEIAEGVLESVSGGEESESSPTAVGDELIVQPDITLVVESEEALPITPEPTPTPTPEVKAPTDVINFHIQPGVAPQVAEVVQGGMLNAQVWGMVNLGITGMRAVDVHVMAGDPGPNPMGNTEPDGRIIFYPRHYQWAQQTPKRLYSGMGHELAHHWQYSRSGLTSFANGMTWIVEGFADYIGFRIAVDQKFLTMKEMEGCFALYTKSSRPMPPPLPQLESRRDWDAAQGSGYWPAELAAHYLAMKYGTNTLITFFDQLPKAGNNWEQAFKMTYGQDLKTFYAEFDRYVVSLPVPGNNSCIDSGMMYQPGK